jgi:Transposase and inactivated derivatives
MKPDDLLNDDFLKQFKNGPELTNFLEQLHNGHREDFEGELDAHLDYDKHQKSKSTNLRNGYSKKKLKTTLGETEIQVPRDRDSSFNPMIVKKRQSTTEGIENIIISLYAKGMSNSDIEEQIRDLYDF